VYVFRAPFSNTFNTGERGNLVYKTRMSNGVRGKIRNKKARHFDAEFKRLNMQRTQNLPKKFAEARLKKGSTYQLLDQSQA
jgi:hypothetical protein